jgi:hypothetical protein
MPLWAWVGFSIIIGYYAYRLITAWNKRQIKFGPVVYDQHESPRTFWSMFALEVVISVFLVTFFGMIIASKMIE